MLVKLVIWINPVKALKLVGELIDVNDVPDESNSEYDRTQSVGYNDSTANTEAVKIVTGVDKDEIAFT